MILLVLSFLDRPPNVQIFSHETSKFTRFDNFELKLGIAQRAYERKQAAG